MDIALLVVVGEAASAFVTLDLFFRYLPLDRLEERLQRYGLYYGFIGGFFCVAGGWVGWHRSGLGGVVLTAMDPLLWWMLWRFGLRKQFSYLFRHDKG